MNISAKTVNRISNIWPWAMPSPAVPPATAKKWGNSCPYADLSAKAAAVRQFRNQPVHPAAVARQAAAAAATDAENHSYWNPGQPARTLAGELGKDRVRIQAHTPIC